ncbi:MAG TPA: hypothetical protein VLT79_02630 [Gemmatimonadales bacterium]|nr:hypothetical protein [Gemmatimonadales bacterium]
MNDTTVQGAVRLGPGDLDPPGFAALRTGAIVARDDAAVVALSGPGAVTCLQGLLTNDVEKPGDGAFVYGAMLTPKGMIVVDGWAARHETTVTFTIPAEARPRAMAILTRSVPPRLARLEDRSPELAVLRLAGPAALERWTELNEFPVPAPGRSDIRPHGWEIARPPDGAPFVLQVTAPRSAAADLEARLATVGVRVANRAVLETARILAGWGKVGAEIDEKTIPQEVRFDELNGVSYTKGCYTGQETVSRLHFRGHVNRYLRGLLFDDAPGDTTSGVTQQDRDVGRVTSLVWLPEAVPRGRWIGLALLRRDVEPGTMARAGNADVRVVALPFKL